MIQVERHRSAGRRIIRPSRQWFADGQNMTRTAIAEKADHQVTDLYKDDEVKKALEKLFYDKCAYCESSPAASSPWDVEHYRPKGRVAERRDHPGYYWLAYAWENLFPACTFCNQKRKDQPRYDDPQELPAQGKLDQFPLEDEAQRAIGPDDDLTLERPFLLNPCVDHPEDHLTYNIQGQIHPIRRGDRRATETIRICHLRRRRLRDARAKIVIQMRLLSQNLRQARGDGNTLAETVVQGVINIYVASDALYAGAARAVQCSPEAFGMTPP